MYASRMHARSVALCRVDLTFHARWLTRSSTPLSLFGLTAPSTE